MPTIKNLLLTSPPGCGKTTVIRRLIEHLAALRIAGFYTQEHREGGRRVGFEAVGISTGIHALLAHTRSRSRIRVGRYGVELAAVVPLVKAELARPPSEVDVFVIDEIGKMELCCDEFIEAVHWLLDGPVPLVATVAKRGGGLIAEAKTRSDVRLVQVTEGNRDALPAETAEWVRMKVCKRQGGSSA
jgi:nucleoside-triphosphatase